MQTEFSSFIYSIPLILKFHYLIQIKRSNHWKERKKTCAVIDGFKVLILKLHPFTMKRTWMQTLQFIYLLFKPFFYKLDCLAGENVILLYLFGKKNNNKITFRCLSNFKGRIVSYFSACIELWTKAVLSSDPAFMTNIAVLRDTTPKLNPVIAPKREHRRERIS